MLDVICLTLNRLDLLKQALSALKATATVPYTLTVIDNGDDKVTEEWLKTSKIDYLKPHQNLGFGKSFNWAIKENPEKFKNPYMLLLSNDIVMKGDWWVQVKKDFDAGWDIIGEKLLYPSQPFQDPHSGTVSNVEAIQFAGGMISTTFLPYHIFRGYTPDYPQANRKNKQLWVTFAAPFIRRKVFDELGGFDPDFHVYCEDLDFCLRANEKGYKILYDPELVFTHHESQFAPREETQKLNEEATKVYLKKWKDTDRLFKLEQKLGYL